MKNVPVLFIILLSACAAKQTHVVTSAEAPEMIDPHVICSSPGMPVFEWEMREDVCRLVWGSEEQPQHTEYFGKIELLGMHEGNPLYLGHNKVDPLSGSVEFGGHGIYVGYGDYENGPWLMISRDAEIDQDSMELIPDSDPNNFLWVVEGKPLFVGVTTEGQRVVWGDEVGPLFYHVVINEGIEIVSPTPSFHSWNRDPELESIPAGPLYIGVHLQGAEKGYRAVWGNLIGDPHVIVTRLHVLGNKLAYTALDELDFGKQRAVWGDEAGPVWGGVVSIETSYGNSLYYRVRLLNDAEEPSIWMCTTFGEEEWLFTPCSP